MTIAEKLKKIAENEPKVYRRGYRNGYIDATSGTAFEIDESTAYRKTVPSASEKLAQVLKLGGMSYKTKNLIPFPYLNTSTEINGVKFTVQDDGGIRVKGTTTSSSAMFKLAIKDTLTLPTNTPLTISGGVSASANSGQIVLNMRRYDANGKDTWFMESIGTSATGTLSTGESLNYIGVYVASGLTVDATVYPMLNEGETALPYEPYFEGIRNAKVTELVSEGANKFNPNAEPSSFYGTSLEVLNNNTWRVTTNYANASSPYYYLISKPIPISGERFYIKAQATPFGNITKGIIKATLRDKNGTEIARLSAYANGEYSNNFVVSKSTYPTAEYIDVTFYASAGDNCDIGDGVEYSNIMVSFDADVPYAPFVGTLATKPIPEALRNFLEQYGYGLGIDSTYFNYIDYVRKVFVQRCKKIVFDGTETWYESKTTSGNARVYAVLALKTSYISPNILTPCICNLYDNKTAAETYGDIEGVSFTEESVRFYDSQYNTTDLSLWKAHLAQLYAEGNPLTVIYALAEPIETDISEYLTGDSLIEVQGGGTITAANVFELAAPSTIQFITKVGA